MRMLFALTVLALVLTGCASSGDRTDPNQQAAMLETRDCLREAPAALPADRPTAVTFDPWSRGPRTLPPPRPALLPGHDGSVDRC